MTEIERYLIEASTTAEELSYIVEYIRTIEKLAQLSQLEIIRDTVAPKDKCIYILLSQLNDNLKHLATRLLDFKQAQNAEGAPVRNIYTQQEPQEGF